MLAETPSTTRPDHELTGVDPSGEVEQRLRNIFTDHRVVGAPKALYQTALPLQRLRLAHRHPVASIHMHGKQVATGATTDDACPSTDQGVPFWATR